MDQDALKLKAAEHALEFVEDGMKLGLGTGSTAAKFVDLLGQSVKDGLKVTCVPTSEATRQQAEALQIPLTTLDDVSFLDLTIDGTDEVDDELRLIKGGGGALLREKIVAMASDRMIVIADQNKKVGTLGKFPLPIEVIKFGLTNTQNLIEGFAASVGCEGELVLRNGADGAPFVTDENHYVIDAHFSAIESPESLADVLALVPGVVETGLFLGIADYAIIATDDGLTVLEAPNEDDGLSQQDVPMS